MKVPYNINSYLAVRQNKEDPFNLVRRVLRERVLKIVWLTFPQEIIIIIMVLFYLFIQYYAVLKEISIR